MFQHLFHRVRGKGWNRSNLLDHSLFDDSISLFHIWPRQVGVTPVPSAVSLISYVTYISFISSLSPFLTSPSLPFTHRSLARSLFHRSSSHLLPLQIFISSLPQLLVHSNPKLHTSQTTKWLPQDHPFQVWAREASLVWVRWVILALRLNNEMMPKRTCWRPWDHCLLSTTGMSTSTG